MTTRFAARATALSMSVFLTLAMLGGVDFLATSEPAASAVMAAAGAPRA